MTCWRSLETQSRPLVEVEDGFLRSQGLGADCVPPLSITVDRLGAYFDPAQPSELECCFRTAHSTRLSWSAPLTCGRSSSLPGSANMAAAATSRTAAEGRRHILVPGQVEDDRSVQTGGCGLSTNLELLMRVREQAPDAYILYKPHPDVVAGHRKGADSGRICLQYADEVVCEPSDHIAHRDGRRSSREHVARRVRGADAPEASNHLWRAVLRGLGAHARSWTGAGSSDRETVTR